jgi:hypothetical protein
VAVEIYVSLAMVRGEAPLCALADVTVRASELQVTIRRCPVFQRTGQPPWTNLPRLAIVTDQKRHFVSLIDLPSELKKRVFSAVLVEYWRVAYAR